METKPKPPCISEVAACLRANGNLFFSKSTLKFFGDKLSNYRTKLEGNQILVIRRKSGSHQRPYGTLHTTGVGKQWVFDAKTATMTKIT